MSQALLNQVLKNLKITAQCVNTFKYRHFIYYDLKLEQDAKVSKIIRSSTEIALALKTKTSIIVTPIPSLGIVRCRSIFSDPEPLFLNKLSTDKPENFILPCLLGDTDEGNLFWMDIAKNPHLLVGGSTGSGKSTLLHTIIANLLKSKVDFYLVDTKKVEFSRYSQARKIVKTYNETLVLLNYLIEIMHARYEVMADNNVNSYKSLGFSEIVLIIDEAADLMLHKKKNNEFEDLLLKLVQQARAAGIFVILATQRPSVDVITGIIKSNFPTRLSCKVASKFDSNVILDEYGAENLLGQGDAIIKMPNGQIHRLQIAHSGELNGRNNISTNN